MTWYDVASVFTTEAIFIMQLLNLLHINIIQKNIYRVIEVKKWLLILLGL